MAKDTSLNQVLLAINRVSRRVNEHFEFIDDRFGMVDETVGHVRARCADMSRRLTAVDQGLRAMRDAVATKEHVDSRMSELRSEIRRDLSAVTRRTDGKIATLLDVLRKRNVISDQERAKVLSAELGTAR